jgi:hypothetical protein
MSEPAAAPNLESSDLAGVRELLIEPAQAEAWLGLNKRNRNIRKAYVVSLADAIRRGEWQLNGDAIRFSKDGDLLDGQHRLHAIVEAGVPIRSLVVSGLDLEAQDTIDRGAKRTLGDVFTIHGITEAKAMAAAASWLHRFEAGTAGKGQGGATTVSPAQALAVYERNPDLHDSIRAGRLMADSGLRLRPSAAVALHYLFAKIDRLDADQFFDALANGTGLAAGDPVLVLRNALIRNASQRLRQRPAVLVAWTIKAWNYWRAGRKIQLIMWREQEGYPVPK